MRIVILLGLLISTGCVGYHNYDYTPPADGRNPFSPSTVIELAIVGGVDYTGYLYDVSGNKVGLLIDTCYEQDTLLKIETFNRLDKKQGGFETLLSGVYFYRIETADTTFTKKIILLK